MVEDIDLQNENSFTFCGGDNDPTYPGGYPAFFAYIQSSLKPLFALVTDSAFFQNPVYVAFKVNEEGCVEDAIIKRGGNELINEHIIMMMYSMPRWECGATDAKKYKTSYTFPITFLLN